MTKAVNPGEEVSEAEMNPLNQLVQEVRSQKMKINELGNILSQQFLKNHHSQPTSPTNSNGPKSDGWELFDMEEELYVTSGGGMKPSQAAQGPSSSPPMASAPMTVNQEVPRQTLVTVPGIPVQLRPPSQARPAPSSENQVALTSAALAHWGKKVVTWGKKHKGDSYEATYEQDGGYVKWVLARVGSLHEELEDFGNYATTRRRLEMAAQQINQ